MNDPDVLIRLTPAEAAVLSELLRRYSETDRLSIEHPSEQRALWNLQCLFERAGDPSWPILADARAALYDEPSE